MTATRLTGRGSRHTAYTEGLSAFRQGTEETGGQQMPRDTKIMIPDVPKASDSAYMKAGKHELFRKRAGIEPVIGHCKSDHRLGQIFYKGLFGDSINVMIAATAIITSKEP